MHLPIIARSQQAAANVTRKKIRETTTTTTTETTTTRVKQAPIPSLCRAAAATAATALVLAAVSPPPAALAAFASVSAAPENVTDFAASGILFRDSVEVTALPDRDVEGATIFIANFNRSLPAKLAKDFFSEPSQASITCAANPNFPLKVINEKAVRASGGTELFSERKGLSLVANKTLRVRRIFDPKRNALLYISYSTRLSDDADTASTRYRTSVCALPLPAEAFNGSGGGGGGGSGGAGVE